MDAQTVFHYSLDFRAAILPLARKHRGRHLFHCAIQVVIVRVHSHCKHTCRSSLPDTIYDMDMEGAWGCSLGIYCTERLCDESIGDHLDQNSTDVLITSPGGRTNGSLPPFTQLGVVGGFTCNTPNAPDPPRCKTLFRSFRRSSQRFRTPIPGPRALSMPYAISGDPARRGFVVLQVARDAINCGVCNITTGRWIALVEER